MPVTIDVLSSRPAPPFQIQQLCPGFSITMQHAGQQECSSLVSVVPIIAPAKIEMLYCMKTQYKIAYVHS